MPERRVQQPRRLLRFACSSVGFAKDTQAPATRHVEERATQKQNDFRLGLGAIGHPASPAIIWRGRKRRVQGARLCDELVRGLQVKRCLPSVGGAPPRRAGVAAAAFPRALAALFPLS